MTRYALQTRGGTPHIWDFGSAAKHHRLNCPWLAGENIHAGMVGLRGAVAADAGLFRRAAREICEILRAEGALDMPLGIDIAEPPMVAALEAEGLTVVDAQQVMLDAREVKSIDEIMLLNTACSMVDGAYQMLAEKLKPGVRESELVADVTRFLFDLGSEHVDNINAVSGERCSPHPHVFSDRIIRPGDQAFFDIIHTFVGYKTCYYRTFVVGKANDAQRDAYKQAREWIDASIELMRPGVGTDQVASVWPKAEEFGFSNEMECFGLQFGHSVGLFLHERPIISRLNSLDHPVELKAGMVIALETYCPAKDGFSAARIEEEVVVTDDGPVVITKFPSDELFVANAY
jgi:Xaa-Pro dipeptidase